MMKKLASLIAVAAVLFVCMGAYITQHQAIAGGALTELKFKSVPDPEGRLGGPSAYEVTDETIEYLQKLKKDGKQLIVDGSGQVTVK